MNDGENHPAEQSFPSDLLHSSFISHFTVPQRSWPGLVLDISAWMGNPMSIHYNMMVFSGIL